MSMIAEPNINRFLKYPIFLVYISVLAKGLWETKLFMFSKKATKFEKIFTVDLALCSKCQIDGEDSVNFCGLLRMKSN